MPPALQRFIPDAATVLTVLPAAALYGVCAAAVAGRLRLHRGVRAPYTRKAFHFLILSAAAVVHLRWGLPGVVVYGSVIALLVVGAVVRGEGSAFYEALARPTDAPHRSFFILVPLITTVLGGVLANLFFPDWAYVGYMAVAWGDAVGEPVGARWGRHRYRVPSLGGVPADRSLEGSGAVLIVSAIACGLVLMFAGIAAGTAFRVAFVIGAATAAVEAVSHHGLDNLTIQLAASGVAAALLPAAPL